MTFIIQEKILKDDPVIMKNVFDPESFNYIFMRSTGIIDGIKAIGHKFFKQEYLSKMKKIDPEMLDLINYTQKDLETHELNSALSIANKNFLYRDIDEILLCLSNVKYQNYSSFVPTIRKCLIYKNFS